MILVEGAYRPHCTLDDKAIEGLNQAVAISSHAGDGRRNFVIPWGEQVYVGTTDDPEENRRAATRGGRGRLLASAAAWAARSCSATSRRAR